MQARVPFYSAQWVVMSVDEQAWLQKQNLPTNCRCSLDSILTRKKKSIGTILCPFSSTLLSFLHFFPRIKRDGQHRVCPGETIQSVRAADIYLALCGSN